jgi:hypothetical protein
MPPMPDAAGHGERPAVAGINGPPGEPADRDSQGLGTGCQATAETRKPDEDAGVSPARSRRFVYRRRSPEDLLNRIRRYEQEHPRPFRRVAGDPEADFVYADEEND